MPADLLAGIKARLQHSGHKADAQGKPWAGEVVAEILEIDLNDVAERKRVKAMIDAWIETGEFAVVEEFDTGLRKPRKFLRPAFCAT